MMQLDHVANNYFNALLADVDWQAGLDSVQRDTALHFAHSWILGTLNSGGDMEREYIRVLGALRALTRGKANGDQ